MRRDERGMGKIEVEIERIALVGRDHQGRIQAHLHRNGEVARTAFGSLDLNLAGRNRRARRAGKSGLRISGHGQGHVSRISANGQRGPRIGTGWNWNVPENFPSWSNCTRLIIGAGVGAVNTVSGEPPPCGVREMLTTFTPMVAQSSVDPSCIRRASLPFWL